MRRDIRIVAADGRRPLPASTLIRLGSAAQELSQRQGPELCPGAPVCPLPQGQGARLKWCARRP